MRAFSVRVTARFECLAKRLHKQHADFAAAYERSIRILTIDPTTGQVRILSRSWRIFRLAKVHGGCALGAGASGTTFGISLWNSTIAAFAERTPIGSLPRRPRRRAADRPGVLSHCYFSPVASIVSK